MDLSGDNIVALTGILLGSNGILLVMLKGTGKLLAKFGKKNVELKDIVNEVRVLADDIRELVNQRTFEDGIKRKRDVILANASGFMRHNKCVHDFAVHKAERFTQFVLDNYKTLWDCDYTSFAKRIYSLSTAVKEEGRRIAGCDYVDFFYDKYHDKDVERYLDDVEKIFKDRVNNKGERFVDVSMGFVQTFLSEMVEAYVEWIRESREA